MTDAFSRLRSELYLDYGRDELEYYRTLSAAVGGTEPATQDTLVPVLESISRLHAAAVSSVASTTAVTIERVTALAGHQCPLEQLGRCDYADRYLARLVGRGDAECSSELERRLAAGVVDRRLDPGLAVAFSRSAGLRPFGADAARQLVRTASGPHGSSEALVEILGYIGEAGLSALVPELRAVLHRDEYPWGVRVEALLALEGFLDRREADREAGTAGLTSVLHVVPEATARRPECPEQNLVQSVFYGDPGRLGKGGSGGLGSLVRELGGALGERLAPVLTVVCYDSRSAAYPYCACEELSPTHLLLRMPVYLASRDPAGFLRSEHRIKAAVDRVLHRAAPTPGIVHVRFLDNASRAVARAARARDIPLVVTLTPDPHRTVCGADGELVTRDPLAAADLLNRIIIGDELLQWSSGVVAIGRDAFAGELIPYFPQLEDVGNRVTAAIDEGVSTATFPPPENPAALLCSAREPGQRLALDPARFTVPLLVTVGRLSPVKGQVTLARAWAESGLHEEFNLVIVGGDLQDPSAEERSICDEIDRIAGTVPPGRLCHLPAQENRVVRGLLSWCAGRRPDFGCDRPMRGYDAYVCPSVKEEFGLSILEAMAAGLPVLATLRGGPRSYIVHGVNGYLVDTRNAEALQRELRTVLVDNRLAEPALGRLKREARSTVERSYSLGSMADEYAAFYRQVRRKKQGAINHDRT